MAGYALLLAPMKEKRKGGGLGARNGTRMRYTMPIIQQGAQMAKPNYSYEKRQKELAKKKKQEEKRKRKQGIKDEPPAADRNNPE